MSNEGKCSEDIFPSYSEPSEFKLRRSQRILQKNPQTIENVIGENYLNYVEESMLPHQTNDYSTDASQSKIIVDSIDGRSTPDFTRFLLNSADTSNENPQKFEFVQQQQTECALDIRDELKIKTTTKIEMKEFCETAKTRGKRKRRASKECSQKLSTLFDYESIIRPERKKSRKKEYLLPQMEKIINNNKCEKTMTKQLENTASVIIVPSSDSFEGLQTDHSTIEIIVDQSATEALQYGRKTKAKSTRKRNPSMECNNKHGGRRTTLENSMNFNECIEEFRRDGNMLRRAQSFNNNSIKDPITKQLKKTASVIVLSSDSCKMIVDKSTPDERNIETKGIKTHPSTKIDENDTEIIQSSGSCKIAPPTEMDIDNHISDKGTSKCNSIKMETIQVSDSKKKNVTNSRRQQNIKSETKTVSKRKATTSSSERKRINVETTESILLSQKNYVAPKVKRYNNSCPNNFPYELVTNKPSLLPAVYPSHFTQQRVIAPQEAFCDQYSYRAPSASIMYLTPENSQILVEPKRSSSTFSITSVEEFFEKDELDEILNTEKIIYHLTEMHVRSLAISLNLNADKLFSLIDNIVELNSNVLGNNFASIDNSASK